MMHKESLSGLYRRFRLLTMRHRPQFVWGIHIAIIMAAFGLAAILQGSTTKPLQTAFSVISFMPFVLAVKLSLFYRLSLFKGSWRYVEIHDLVKIFKAVTVAAVILLIGVYLFTPFRYPVVVIDWCLSLVLIAGSRLTLKYLDHAFKLENDQTVRRAMIVGAGDAGEMICREMLNNPALGYLPVCFADDQPKKHGLQIHGVPVKGASSEIPDLVHEHAIHEIVIAVPSAKSDQFERIFRICKSTGIPFKTVPATRAILEGRATVEQLREVRLEDLLNREPVRVDDRLIGRALKGQRVLITGAGGSIGSELARQVAAFDPAVLILYDRDETALHDIELELKRKLPNGRLFPVLGDVLDHPNLDRVMARHRPEWVFHAAAYKHVPMMEHNPIEAVKVNVLGAHCVAETAVRYGVQKLVYISTDKAVRPSSIMGMTKRIGEMVTLSLFNGKLSSVAVRFGNVLGSNGSVVPLFQKQIAEGGPVTVTDPDVSRFFMTIPEAVQLVLMAGILGDGGEIFILDMGEPVKIVDLARKLIELAGLEPDRDIKLVFTGLRPGEKLHEELLIEGEDILPTQHEKIKQVRSNHLPESVKADRIALAIKDLEQLVLLQDAEGSTQYLSTLILKIDGGHMRKG
jgi:FlaA1/EpsC-like NDP-sugar epimerase